MADIAGLPLAFADVGVFTTMFVTCTLLVGRASQPARTPVLGPVIITTAPQLLWSTVTSSTADWQPFSTRVLGTRRADDTLHEGVPDHLEGPLRDWLSRAITDRLAERVNLRLRRVGGKPMRTELIHIDQHRLLDAIDAVLALGPEADVATLRRELINLLEDGGSAYRLIADCTGLERRVDPAVTQAFHATAASTRQAGRGDAAAHLDEAWRKVYGLHPDPGVAYREAVRAVEAAAIPVVIPADPAPTLGKVRSSMEQGAAKWELVIAANNGTPASIDPLVAMIALLWEGHRDRHAGGPTSAPITQAAAEAAVHLAATLVQWFVVGAIRRKLGS